MSLLSQSEITSFTGEAIALFNTQKVFNTIVVVKEPQKIISDISADVLPGYGNTSNLDNVTYVPVSGVFNGILINPTKDYINKLFQSVPIFLTEGDKILKVDKEARDYINNGKTERIIVNNDEIFNVKSDSMTRNFGGLNYYYYHLQKTS